MKGGKRSWMMTVTVVVAAIAIVTGVYYFYGVMPADNPPISVSGGHLNVTYASHFKDNSSTNDYLFSTNASHTVVSDVNHPNSNLSVSLQGGEIYYDTADNDITISFNLVIGGLLTTNLHPKSLTVSYDGQGLKNQSAFMFGTWAPPYSNLIPTAYNLSVDNWGNLWHDGPGSVNVTNPLLNESNSLQFYSFYLSLYMTIHINWYPDSTHTFYFSSLVNGLSKPVVAGVSMSIVDLGS